MEIFIYNYIEICNDTEYLLKYNMLTNMLKIRIIHKAMSWGWKNLRSNFSVAHISWIKLARPHSCNISGVAVRL